MVDRSAISIFKVRIEGNHEKLRIGGLRIWIRIGESALDIGLKC
jgi:hypothetical protein